MSKRKPYVRPMTATWWLSNPFYIKYMLREGSCLFVGGYALVLLWGVYALKQGAAAWGGYLDALASPLALLFHAVALAMALYHSVTWFALAPKAMHLQLGDKKVADSLIEGGHFAAFVVACVVIIVLVSGVL